MLQMWFEDLADAARRRTAFLGPAWRAVRRGVAWIVANLQAAAKLAIAFLVVVIALAALREPIVVEPLDVAVAIKERVPPGDVLSRRVVDHIAGFGRAVEELKAEKDTATPSRSFELPDLEVPGVGVSLRQVIEITRRVLGLRDYRIAGEVFAARTPVNGPGDGGACADGSALQYLHVRLRSDRGDELFHEAAPICPAAAADKTILAREIDLLLMRAALDTYSTLSPCGAAAYYFRNWRKPKPDGHLLDPMMKNADELIGKCLLDEDEREAGYAYYLRGRIRQAAGRPEEAVESFDAAKRLHDMRPLMRVRDWISRQLAWVGLPVIPSYLPILHVHWGNSLLDHRTEDPGKRLALVTKARQQFEAALSRDRRVSLAYSGLGNVLGEMERLGMGRGYSIAAACLYRDGGKRRRFDADLRHNFGNLLERYGDLIERTEREEGKPWDARGRWLEVAGQEAVGRYCRGKDPMFHDRKDKVIATRLKTLELATQKHVKAAELEPATERYLVAWARTEMRLGEEIARTEGGSPAEVTRRFAIAERSFQRVLDTGGGTSFEAWDGRARLRRLEGDVVGELQLWWQAAGTLAEAAYTRPDDHWLKYHQGRAYLELGEQERAVAELEAVLKRHGTFAPAWLALARFHAANGRDQEAWRYYSRALLHDAQSLEDQDKPIVDQLRARFGVVR